jgi:RNA polymerase sigma factor (sigma-70 family)
MSASIAQRRQITNQALAELRVPNHRILTREEEVELAKKIERGDLAAKAELVSLNQRLVMSIAVIYIGGHDLTLFELYQEGMIGCIRAAEKFDWRKGYKFSTYATWWIRQQITRAIPNTGFKLRPPVHFYENWNKVNYARARLNASGFSKPSVEQISKESGLDVKKVKAVLEYEKRIPISLDKPVGDGDDDEMSVASLISASEEEEPSVAAVVNLRDAFLLKCVRELPRNEGRVIEAHFGLGGSPKLTFEQIGREIGVTRERVRQIELSGLRRLGELHGSQLRVWFDEDESPADQANEELPVDDANSPEEDSVAETAIPPELPPAVEAETEEPKSVVEILEPEPSSSVTLEGELSEVELMADTPEEVAVLETESVPLSAHQCYAQRLHCLAELLGRPFRYYDLMLEQRRDPTFSISELYKYWDSVAEANQAIAQPIAA